MKSLQFSKERETIIAENIRDVVSDLRLVDPADYIAFIRCELFANIADLVSSAAELYFYPGTLGLGHGGEFHCDWQSPPSITLDMEFRQQGVYAYFRITLTDRTAGVELNHIAFEDADGDPSANTVRLAKAFEDARCPCANAPETRLSFSFRLLRRRAEGFRATMLIRRDAVPRAYR
ncbi:hypothetical protein [Brucella abortus]|uniref:hypothetical protein n=1 Tax=Brucella abortus TaxID=235 RepID=UPI0002CFFC30|nr:hypothetical protein [Brucella abortus]ENR99376.1 hypothetical protein C030_02207 [Brucella abortus 85/69]